MKKILFATLVIVLAGLAGTFIAQNTDIPLWLTDRGYRAAVALEKQYPFIDVWEFSSDGEFIYVVVKWDFAPPERMFIEVRESIDAYVAAFKTTERRVVFYDIMKIDGNYLAVSMLSCLADNFGTDGPIVCDRWPWPVRVRPEAFPWVGR